MTNLIDTFKALANEHRLQMLVWLNRPAEHFPDFVAEYAEMQTGGWICVGKIAEKAGLAQSVVSGYLNTLKSVDLVESQRMGKWTYYRISPQARARLNEQISELFA
ncbi:ArsR family transcriptional regulator [Moraxella nasibovis]|uniref:ArsR/SmtB family transcription factor n=1 Tax=Moraxella nasibovis TaxID=2904120 RepID=UPI002410454A|nr:metalloregulator ArsR/SmtB family transcription factor [Moraxella nasibovis]WFF38833.1 ArsR family transcriptional regulator [Moraxella nasibovis]